MTRARRWPDVLGALVLTGALTQSGLRAQQPDRSQPPELGPPPRLQLPPIQRETLSNGLQVLIFEKHEVPLVQIDLLVKTGSAMDPAGKGGLASLTGEMLDEGAAGQGALELADAVDFLGADLSISVDEHATMIALHTPLARLDSALAVVADVALRPDFPAVELERQRKERLTTLLQWRDEPRALASVEFDRVLYGDAHPYGRPGIGTAASLAAFTVEDLKTFYQRWYRPNNAALIVVGDITTSAILPKLEAMFAAWPSASVPQPAWPKAEPSERREVYLVDKPGAAQSEIRVGRIGVSRDTEAYYALIVMNTILGGSFTSRLNQNLREEHGYSYGARSFFDFEILPGPFTAGAAVQTAVTDSALAEMMSELRRIREPVSDEELERARNFVALRFPERFQTVTRIADQLADLELYSLPDDYFNTYVDRILGVTRDEVRRVAREYIDADRMAIVIVGDREVIERGVRGLDLGAMHVLSVEDVLGKPPVIDQAE